MMLGMRRLRSILLIYTITSLIGSSFAKDLPYIAVGNAHTKKTVIAYAPIVLSESSNLLSQSVQTITQTVVRDLDFMDLFRFLGSSAFIEDSKKTGITMDSFKFSDWSSIGAELLIKSAFSNVSDNTFSYETYLYDLTGGKQILAKKYISTYEDLKTVGHSFANDLVKALTGLPGIFLTKIAMSCDLTHKKEIYIMDFDGSNVKQITQHGSIAFAPAWSPSGTKIAYSLFKKHKNNVKNIDLYEYDFQTSTIRMLSNRKGINSGAAYSPDGKKIALTMSFTGNPEIFALDPANTTVTRLTSSFGVDVDPSWSPDGKSMAFVSSRTGMPMVFNMQADGSKVQRLTYAGRYNATPNWSPQNNKIVFAGWIDQTFDIFIMNPDGTTIERLSKNQGNNEDPYFSPDGNFVIFSSNRTGQQNIYVMNIDGTFVKRLTYGLGNCVTPKWSNPPNVTLGLAHE